jgi:hypothetical protein
MLEAVRARQAISDFSGNLTSKEDRELWVNATRQQKEEWASKGVRPAIK